LPQPLELSAGVDVQLACLAVRLAAFEEVSEVLQIRQDGQHRRENGRPSAGQDSYRQPENEALGLLRGDERGQRVDDGNQAGADDNSPPPLLVATLEPVEA